MRASAHGRELPELRASAGPSSSGSRCPCRSAGRTWGKITGERVTTLPARKETPELRASAGSGLGLDADDKRAEYAAAGIPWYWVARLDDGGVSSIEILALDHGLGGYRLVSLLEPGAATLGDGPIRVRLDWNQLRV
jgi:hypothetical protein